MTQAKQGVKTGSLRSPISGTVVALDVKAGEIVGEDASKVLAKVVDLGAIKLKARMLQEDSTLIEEGKNVVMAFVEIPNKTFDGKVTKVQAIPSEAGGALKEVIIDFKNDEGAIKEGFKVDWVGVKVGEVKGVLAVPVYAVTKDSTGKPIVKVMEGQDWKPQVVETGLSDGKYIEIKSGVKEGDTVQVVPPKD
jgi:HlyD family secretion protein